MLDIMLRCRVNLLINGRIFLMQKLLEEKQHYA